jgi:hypothetical protein
MMDWLMMVDGLVVNDLGMDVVLPVNDSVESVVSVGGVVYSALGTVGFDEGVAATYNVTVPSFVLALDITCVKVMYRVVEVVTGMRVVVIVVSLLRIYWSSRYGVT